MSTDRELLELAAKAAGVPVASYDGDVFGWRLHDGMHWNPLEDDGDALRLAVKLKLALSFSDGVALCAPENGGFCADEQASDHEGDRDAATRRAVVRAAAELGSHK